MGNKIKSPVELGAVILCKIISFDPKGNSQNYVRRMVVTAIPTTTSENIVFDVYDSNEKVYGACDVTIKQFNHMINSGEFKIVSNNSAIKIAS